MAGKVLIVMPTYNEIDNLPRMLPALEALNLGLEILIIDDGSPDGTGNWVKGQQTTRPHLHLIERSGKLGLGSAYVRGFRFALEKGYDFVFEMDADFSHDPSYIPEFLETIKECDLVLGSRYINGVTVVNWPMSRVLMSYYASAYVRWVTGLPVRDTTAGFVCYTAKVLKAIELDKIKFKGYAFQIEMKFTAWKIGFSIEEVSIIFYDRTMGQSKMTSGIFKEAFFGVLDMKISSWFRKFPKKISNS